MNKITQKEMVFYKLWTEHRKNPERYVPAWEFVGEMLIEEFNHWVLMSYKTPANGVKIFFENPGLIERYQVMGKSGAKYYAYRIKPGVTEAAIIDPNLLKFYHQIKVRLAEQNGIINP